MSVNVGKFDKTLRFVLGVALLLYVLTGNVAGTATILFGIAAIVLMVTGLVNYCPLYRVCGISTRSDAHIEEK